MIFLVVVVPRAELDKDFSEVVVAAVSVNIKFASVESTFWEGVMELGSAGGLTL